MLNKIRTRIFIREAAQIIGTVLMVEWSILKIKKVKGIVDNKTITRDSPASNIGICL